MKALMLLVSMMVCIGLASPALAAAPSPADVVKKACNQDSNLAGCTGQQLDAQNGNNEPYLKTLVDVFFYVTGTVAFIFIIIGGIRYITATGDSTRIQKAKNTLLYAVIGVIVALLAIPISNFVIDKVAS